VVKTLVLLILLFDGTLIKKEINFPLKVSVEGCFNYAKMYREATSKYLGPGLNQGWYLNDKTGTYQGFICE